MICVNYLHLDMIAYFALVEQEFRPNLRGRPVAVVPVMAQTTSCIAASYEAKAFGVKAGTRLSDARHAVYCAGMHGDQDHSPNRIAFGRLIKE